MLGMHARGRCKPGRRAQLQRKHFANRFGAREVLLTFGGGPVEAAAAADIDDDAIVFLHTNNSNFSIQLFSAKTRKKKQNKAVRFL